MSDLASLTLEEKRVKAVELAQTGLTQKEVAQLLATSQPNVSRWLKRAGLRIVVPGRRGIAKKAKKEAAKKPLHVIPAASIRPPAEPDEPLRPLTPSESSTTMELCEAAAHAALHALHRILVDPQTPVRDLLSATGALATLTSALARSNPTSDQPVGPKLRLVRPENV